MFQRIKKRAAIFALAGFAVFTFVTLAWAAPKILNGVPDIGDSCPFKKKKLSYRARRFMQSKDSNGDVHCYEIECGLYGGSWVVIGTDKVKDNDCASN